MQSISRRKFVVLTAAGMATSSRTLMAAPSGNVTAQEIADRVSRSLGVEWKPRTVDGFKAGDPSIVVTGIATTALASMDVLARAAKAGANLIVTCEPTFYGHADAIKTDPVIMAKDAFIKEHKLVVFRLSDHWRLRTPDPFVQGLANVLGWSKFGDANEPRRLLIPEMSLEALVSHIKTTLKLRGGMRIVGDPKLRVRKVTLLPGSTPLQTSLNTLPGSDAVIGGEMREWESVEYARDAVAEGSKTSLTLLGRIVSENPGMQVCAEWLKGIVPEVKSSWVPASDPYWRPV